MKSFWLTVEINFVTLFFEFPTKIAPDSLHDNFRWFLPTRKVVTVSSCIGNKRQHDEWNIPNESLYAANLSTLYQVRVYNQSGRKTSTQQKCVSHYENHAFFRTNTSMRLITKYLRTRCRDDALLSRLNKRFFYKYCEISRQPRRALRAFN